MLLLLPVIVSFPILSCIQQWRRKTDRYACSLYEDFLFLHFVWQGSDLKQKCVGKSSDL